MSFITLVNIVTTGANIAVVNIHIIPNSLDESNSLLTANYSCSLAVDRVNTPTKHPIMQINCDLESYSPKYQQLMIAAQNGEVFLRTVVIEMWRYFKAKIRHVNHANPVKHLKIKSGHISEGTSLIGCFFETSMVKVATSKLMEVLTRHKSTGFTPPLVHSLAIEQQII